VISESPRPGASNNLIRAIRPHIPHIPCADRFKKDLDASLKNDKTVDKAPRRELAPRGDIRPLSSSL
jgi:hypothetical protein